MTNFAQDDRAVKEHRYFVYIMCSSSGTLYTGMTNDIYGRALRHKRGEIEGFSAKYKCNRLVHHETFDDAQGDRSRKAIEALGKTKKDCADRISESPLGRFG